MNTKNHRENKMHGQFGFTLIEVMIALVILAVGLLALATMQIVSIRSNAFSSEMTYATMLAQSELEEIRNMNYDDVDSVPEDTLPVDPTTKGIAYTVERQVQAIPDTSNMKTVTLIITWLGAPAGSAPGETEVLFTTRFSTVINKK